MVQTNSSDVGGIGGGIGYSGIPNSVGIEFDNWFNSAFDNNDNHVGVNIGGNINSVARNDSPGFTFDAGGDLIAWIDYDGSTDLIAVRLNNVDVRPGSALLSFTTDLATALGTPNAFVGFTSGTGAAWANHDVISGEFRDTFAPVDVDPRDIPEPAALGLLGLGIIGLMAVRRRLD